MNKVFQHRLAYKVTTQEEADEMKAALLALGYTWAAFETNDWEKYPILYNDWNNIIGKLGFGDASRIYDSYLCTTSELFLALAAQVIGKKFHVGEYVVSESYNKADKISRIIEMDYSAHYHIVTELEPNNKWNQNHSSIRKATKEEITKLMEICSRFSVKSKGFIEAAKQLNRTSQACATRHNLTLKARVTEKAKPIFIPEVTQIKQTPQFMETVQVTMFKAMDGSLHTEELHAIKANVRSIIDSIPDKDADDSMMHSFFVNNKDKVEYLINTPTTLWN